MFSHAILQHPPFIPTSDHCPLLLDTGYLNLTSNIKLSRRFERWWTMLLGHQRAIQQAWLSAQHLCDYLNWQQFTQRVITNLQKWSNNHQENHRHKSKIIWHKLHEATQKGRYSNSNSLQPVARSSSEVRKVLLSSMR